MRRLISRIVRAAPAAFQKFSIYAPTDDNSSAARNCRKINLNLTRAIERRHQTRFPTTVQTGLWGSLRIEDQKRVHGRWFHAGSEARVLVMGDR
jgi:hypothetical protein